MKWKDSLGSSRPDSESTEDYLDEEAYSPWQKGSPGSWLSDWMRKPAAVYVLAIAGVIILVVALGSIFFGSGGKSYDRDIQGLSERITQLEDRMGKAENLYDSVSRIDELQRKNEQLKGRFDRMEAALALRMDHFAQRLDGAKGRATPPPPKKSVPKTTAPKPAKKASPALYHTVVKGDTLYSIGRKYGVTTDQLRRLNDLSGEKINLKQKLLIRPAG